jgi:hypothetical protein
MSVKTFRKALEIAENHGDYIMLGGGEPTLHPQFESFLIWAIASNEEPPHIVTNGKIKNRALLIAKLSKADLIFGELSQDCFHEPIDDQVVKAFGKSIRDVTKGLWESFGIVEGREIKRRGLSRRPKYKFGLPFKCRCDDIFVKPNGKIYQCGCPDSPCIGDVSNGYNSLGDLGDGTCWHDLEPFSPSISAAFEAA